MAYGLLLLRLVVGGTMFAHGAQKLFGWFGGGGPRGTAAFFGKLRFRAPYAMALLAAAAETAGLLLALGLVTPLAAFAIAVVMLVAIASVHWQKGFFVGKGGYEFNLVLLAAAVALVGTGPGRFSLDRALGWESDVSGLWWMVGVVGAAAVAAAATLVVGREAPEPEPAAADQALTRDPAVPQPVGERESVRS